MRIWNGKYNVFGGVWGENKVLHEESQSESNFFFFLPWLQNLLKQVFENLVINQKSNKGELKE